MRSKPPFKSPKRKQKINTRDTSRSLGGYSLKNKSGKTIRIIVIIVIIILIIFAALYYFFGNSFISNMMYNNAIKSNDIDKKIKNLKTSISFDERNSKAQIALANIYMAADNYVMVQEILNKAIKALPGSYDITKLLVQSYTKSGDITKALEIMKGISSDFVLKKLLSERPANIQYSPEQKSYDSPVIFEFISVPDVSIYYTLDGKAPTMQSPIFTESFELTKGQHQIRAVAINQDGLISDELILNYGIQTENQALIFKDKKIEKMIRQILNKPTQTIYSAELASIDLINNLDQDGNRLSGDIISVDDLSYLTNLQTLELYDEKLIDDFSQLQTLNKLEFVTITGAQMGSMGLDYIIHASTGIKKLDLSDCQIASLDALVALSSLQSLNVSKNQISDFTPIKSLKSLTYLNISENKFNSVNGIDSLSELTQLYMSSNTISDVKQIGTLKKLNVLDISKNNISSLNGLLTLPALKELHAADIKLTSFSEFIGNTVQFDVLNLSNCKVSDITPLINLSVVMLNLSGNNISDIAPIGTMKSVSEVVMDNNKITDIKPLTRLDGLVNVSFNNNYVDTLSPLGSLKNLKTVSCKGNPIANVSQLPGVTVTK